MSSSTKSFEWGIIADSDKQLTDYEIIEKDRLLEEQWKKRDDEIRKRELKEDPNSVLKAYRASHFFCGKTVILLKDSEAVIKHKSQCSKCISIQDEKDAAMAARKEGISKMKFILGTIELKKQSIEEQIRIQKRELSQQQENYRVVISMCEHKIVEAENIIKREQKELDKLLKHSNPITRDSAQAEYDENYVKLSDRDRKRVHLFDQVL